jgi:putative heme iron utilization protein
MLGGIAEKVAGDEAAVLRRRYLSAHPSAEVFVDFADFSLFRIRPASIHLVAGFGRIVDLTPTQVTTDITGAESLIEAEPSIIEHMNADHLDTMNLYATRLLGARSADWRCTGCDPDGIDLEAGSHTLRLEFAQRIMNPTALREALKELANHARRAAEG